MSDFEPTQPIAPLADGDRRGWTGHTQPIPPSGSLAPHQAAPVESYPAYAPYPVQPYGYAARPSIEVMTDANRNGVHVTFAWIFTVLTLGYLLPWAVAATRGKSNALAIGLLNFLLGWTFLGWLAALVMACGSHQTYTVSR
jgi:hypothetical protein